MIQEAKEYEEDDKMDVGGGWGNTDFKKESLVAPEQTLLETWQCS